MVNYDNYSSFQNDLLFGKGNTHPINDIPLAKIDRIAETTEMRRRMREEEDEKEKEKSCCYLVSASTSAMGMPLDNELVKILTQFRFGWVRKQPGKLRELVEYARKAPLIIKEINSRSDASEIYKEIHKRVAGITSIIESGDNETAYQQYKNMATELRDRFLPEIQA